MKRRNTRTGTNNKTRTPDIDRTRTGQEKDKKRTKAGQKRAGPGQGMIKT
jgi:hypothetical protein